MMKSNTTQHGNTERNSTIYRAALVFLSADGARAITAYAVVADEIRLAFRCAATHTPVSVLALRVYKTNPRCGQDTRQIWNLPHGPVGQGLQNGTQWAEKNRVGKDGGWSQNDSLGYRRCVDFLLNRA
jgi:hypothetical protein